MSSLPRIVITSPMLEPQEEEDLPSILLTRTAEDMQEEEESGNYGLDLISSENNLLFPASLYLAARSSNPR